MSVLCRRLEFWSSVVPVFLLLATLVGCSRTNDQLFTDQVQLVKTGKASEIDIREKPISGDNALLVLQNTVGLRKLNLDNSPVTDAGLASLGPMPELRDLSLTRTLITDDAIVMIARQFPSLVSLRLDRTAITDKGLSGLKSLTSLQQLSLFRTRTSDVGCAELANIASLKSLSVDQTLITDAALQTLVTLPQLEALSIWNTSVSDAAADQFIKEHDKIKLNR